VDACEAGRIANLLLRHREFVSLTFVQPGGLHAGRKFAQQMSNSRASIAAPDVHDRLTNALGRIERDGHIQLETLALFVRYELAIHAPLAENDQAGRAIAAKRFEAFIAQVGRQIAAGRRTIGNDPERIR
jgi:hypothetical protein